MPILTNVEKALLDDLYGQAESLMNGHSGNVEKMGEVVAKTAKVVVAMARTGGVSPEECHANQAAYFLKIEALIVERVSRSDWKAKLAIWVPLSAALFGLGVKVLSL